MELQGHIPVDKTPWESASGGKAVACPQTTQPCIAKLALVVRQAGATLRLNTSTRITGFRNRSSSGISWSMSGFPIRVSLRPSPTGTRRLGGILLVWRFASAASSEHPAPGMICFQCSHRIASYRSTNLISPRPS
jgi:hypothetical protein